MSDSESQPLLSEGTASVPLGSRVIVERQGDILRLAVPARGLRQGGGGILGFGLFWCLAIGAIAGVMTWAGALAQTSAEHLGKDRVNVSGDGESVQVDFEPVQRGVSALVQATLRHGGLETVDVRVRGREIDVAPVTASASSVVTGADLRDLGAAVAVLLLETLGGGVSVEGETLTVRLPG